MPKSMAEGPNRWLPARNRWLHARINGYTPGIDGLQRRALTPNALIDGSADSASASVVTITIRALHILVSGGIVVLQQSCPQDPFSFWFILLKDLQDWWLGNRSPLQ